MRIRRRGDGETWGFGDGEVGEIFYELFSIILLNFKNLYDLYGCFLFKVSGFVTPI